MRPNLDAGLTRELAAVAVAVPATTISMWALRGWTEPDGTERRLTVVGKDERGRRLYRYGDLLDAERATGSNPNSRRGTTRSSRPAAIMEAA
ncbi:hypothetical protein [Polymorphospora lycopeni]|uniref:MerR family transcriptional regulator n=1 Tax=Polymorphospora lycopeni TaxID=3140240 RepID=A0ABV5CKV1_9ACTN